MRDNIRVNVDTETFVRFWLVVFALAVLGLFIVISRKPLLIVGISIFLAAALTPSVNKLASWIPGQSRLAGTALAYIIVIALLGGFILLVVPPIIQQSAKFAQTVPDIAEQLTREDSGLREIVVKYDLQDQIDSAALSVKQKASEWAGDVGSAVINGVGSFARAVVNIAVTLVMTFFMLIEGPGWMNRIWLVYRDKAKMRHHKKLAEKTYKVVTSYVNGQLLVAAIAGLLAGITVMILSAFFEVPRNLAFPVAAITGVFGLIPMFGATIGGILACILIAFNDIGGAIVFAIYLVIYQQVEGNLITTYIQSKTLNLSPLTVLVAVTIGTFVFGLLGGLISIPIAGVVQIFINDYLENRPTLRTPSDKLAKKTVKQAKKSTA